MRTDALAAQRETDPIVYESQATLAKEVATVLRRNVVQAVKVADAKDHNEKDTWSEQHSILSTPRNLTPILLQGFESRQTLNWGRMRRSRTNR
jgi:hypothetical protein